MEVDVAAPLEETLPPLPRGPWGAWATAGWALLVLLVFVAAGIAATAALVIFEPAAGFELAEDLESDGDLLAISTLATTVVCTGLIFLVVRLRRGPAVAEYLALRPARPLAFAGWLGLGLIFAGLSDSLTLLLERPIVPEFARLAYATAELEPLLWLAFVAAAPLFEEVLFRGFVITGLVGSRFGATGAVVASSLVWTLIHVQYGPYELATLFVLGLLLGASRLATGSLLVPLAIHAVLNLIATVQTAIFT